LAEKGKDAVYFDVTKDGTKLEEMLQYSQGKRKVPVIVEAGQVSIGFNGKT
jgi:glutaredoxin